VTGPLSFAPAPDLGTALPRLNGESSETPRQGVQEGSNELPRSEGFRRTHCACGCPLWWYEPRSFHRPRIYATDACRRRAKQARDRADWPYRREVQNAARKRRRLEGKP
jgi:hypothetical protein